MKSILTLSVILFTIPSLQAQLKLVPQDTGTTSGRDFEIIILNRSTALDWCNKGIKQFQNSNFEGVIKLCRKGLEFDAECATAFHMIGLSNILLKNTSEGCADLKKAMALSDSTTMFGQVLFKDYRKQCE